VNTAASSFVVLGVTVKVDARTRLEDQSSAQLRQFALANIHVGDYVEIRGGETPAGSGNVLATLVERTNLQQDSQVQGFVQSVTPPLLTVLGVQVTTNGGTLFNGISGVAQLAVGDLVKVTGQKLGDRAMTAARVEVDD
jgi:ribosomal protein L24